MTPTDLPIIGAVVEAGPDDRIFDSLLLLGPVVIAVIVVIDLPLITRPLAGAYLAVFVLYVLYQGLR